jgi:hypothetical protein
VADANSQALSTIVLFLNLILDASNASFQPRSDHQAK